MTAVFKKVTFLRSVFVITALLVLAPAFPARAQDQCAPLFQETKTRWATVRDRIPGLRHSPAAEAFEKELSKRFRGEGAENVLIGQHRDGRFGVLGWANVRTIDYVSQTVEVEFRGEARTVPMDSVFIQGNFRDFGRATLGWRTDETGLRRLYFYGGFSPNGYILASSFRSHDDSGFDAFPYTQFTNETKAERKAARAKNATGASN